jgi:hypothetical protein
VPAASLDVNIANSKLSSLAVNLLIIHLNFPFSYPAQSTRPRMPCMHHSPSSPVHLACASLQSRYHLAHALELRGPPPSGPVTSAPKSLSSLPTTTDLGKLTRYIGTYIAYAHPSCVCSYLRPAMLFDRLSVCISGTSERAAACATYHTLSPHAKVLCGMQRPPPHRKSLPCNVSSNPLTPPRLIKSKSTMRFRCTFSEGPADCRTAGLHTGATVKPW